MTAIRVFILTTDGPVEVQRITAEDPGVKSVICLDGKAVALPVSPAYEAFVRSPTGVIESCFGHPAYRLDVSGRISQGLSWQLGVFLAHALHDAGRLGNAGAEVAVLTTGEVDRDLKVLPVDAVAEKLARAAPLLSELADAGVTPTVLLPAESAAGLDNAVRTASVATIGEAFEALGLAVPGKAVPATAAAAARPRRSALPVATVAVLLIVCAAVAWWLMERDRLSVVAAALTAKPPPPPAADLVTTLVETRAPAGATCAAVHFDTARPARIEASVAKSGQFTDSAARGLCGLAYRITNKGPPVDLTVLAARGMRGAGSLQTKIFLRNQRLEAGGQASLTVKPPRTASPVRYEFLLLAETVLDRGAADPPYAGPLPDEIPSDRWRAIPAAVARDGLSVFTVTHILAP